MKFPQRFEYLLNNAKIHEVFSLLQGYYSMVKEEYQNQIQHLVDRLFQMLALNQIVVKEKDRQINCGFYIPPSISDNEKETYMKILEKEVEAVRRKLDYFYEVKRRYP